MFSLKKKKAVAKVLLIGYHNCERFGKFLSINHNTAFGFENVFKFLFCFRGTKWKNVNEPNLGLLSPAAQQSQSTDTRLQRKVQRLFAGCQARKKGNSCSKEPNSLMTFRKCLLRTAFGMRVDGLFLIGLWWDNWVMAQNSQSLAFWFQLGLPLSACSQLHPSLAWVWEGHLSFCKKKKSVMLVIATYIYTHTLRLFYYWNIV